MLLLRFGFSVGVGRGMEFCGACGLLWAFAYVDCFGYFAFRAHPVHTELPFLCRISLARYYPPFGLALVRFCSFRSMLYSPPLSSFASRKSYSGRMGIGMVWLRWRVEAPALTQGCSVGYE